MLMKFCPRCNNKLEYGNKYCKSCTKEIETEQNERYKTFLRVRKANGGDKEAYKRYANKRTDNKEQKFYNSCEWKGKREYILIKYKYIDIYAYYTTGKIIPADTVHHIIELKKDWNKRLENYNLFPISSSNHKIIHERIIFEGNEEVIKELNEMLEKFRKEFNIEL